MDLLIKTEQSIYLADDSDRSFINTQLQLPIATPSLSSNATSHLNLFDSQDTSFNSTIESFTNGLLLPTCSSSSSSSSTSSFFISSASSTGLDCCLSDNQLTNPALFVNTPDISLPPLSPTRSASSTSSSLSLSIDINSANFFLSNNSNQNQHSLNYLNHQVDRNFTKQNCLISDSYENFSLLSADNHLNNQFINHGNFNQNIVYSNWNNFYQNPNQSYVIHNQGQSLIQAHAGSKQDVSVGTDLTISRDLRYKKDFDWLDNFKLANSASTVRPDLSNTLLITTNSMNNMNMNTNLNQLSNSNSATSSSSMRLNEKESFKLVEKIQPKKSRTKYTKEQIEVLESAYWRNAYPDLITVEHLCKSLGITKEKINIWFQNRRARSKKHGI